MFVTRELRQLLKKRIPSKVLDANQRRLVDRLLEDDPGISHETVHAKVNKIYVKMPVTIGAVAKYLAEKQPRRSSRKLALATV